MRAVGPYSRLDSDRTHALLQYRRESSGLRPLLPCRARSFLHVNVYRAEEGVPVHPDAAHCRVHNLYKRAMHAPDNDEVRSTAGEDYDDDRDRKSTRLNSSHGYISYAVFCLKKKNKKTKMRQT